MVPVSLFARILPVVVALSVYRLDTGVPAAIVTNAGPARAPENPKPAADSDEQKVGGCHFAARPPEIQWRPTGRSASPRSPDASQHPA